MKQLLRVDVPLQLEPFQYPIFVEIVDHMIANTWTPDEKGVGPDLQTIRTLESSPDLQDQSRLHYFKTLWGQLTAFDILRSEDATMHLLRLVQLEEVKDFLIRLMWEERLHTRAYRYVVQNLGLPDDGPDSIYTMWAHVPSLKQRVEYTNRVTHTLQRVSSQRSPSCPFKKEEMQTILKAMIFQFLIFQKVWFMINLSGPLQHMARVRPGGEPKHFEGAAKQLYYIARDEEQHVRGGVHMIRYFAAEHPEAIDDSDFIQDIQSMYEECIMLESLFAVECSKVQPLVGYLPADHIETAKFFANMGAKATGFLPEPFPGAKHRFPWMSEMMDLKRETNFFEDKPTDYQAGRDLWKDNDPAGAAWDADLFTHLEDPR